MRTALRRARRAVRALRGGTPGSQSPLFVGVTRFSVFQPDVGAWKLTRGTADAESYREQLYSPERMRPRCDIFLKLTVPILQQMADLHDYRHIVHYTDSMPDPWRSELLETARRYPVLLLHPDESGRAVRHRITELARAGSQGERTVVQFRLDDDDLLAVSYLDQLSQYASPADRGRAVSLARGYTAHFRDGSLGPVHVVNRVFGAQGLAFIGHYDPLTRQARLRSNVNHAKVARYMPTIVHTRTPAFFQMRHVGQDMLTDATSQVRAIEGQMSRLQRERDLGVVRAAFPTLVPLLRDHA